MIVATSEVISDKRIVKTLGLVRGNTIRARHLGKDILAVFRNIIGGEVAEYTKLMGESREQALDRMKQARQDGDVHQETKAGLDYTLLTEYGERNIFLYNLMKARLFWWRGL